MKLELKDVTVVRGGKPVLAAVSVLLPPGARTLLLGWSGGGKTSLLKVLAGLLPPDSGAVLWDDGAPNANGRQRLGMSFQTDALFDSLTVLDNVLLPLRRRLVAEDAARQRAEQVLSRVGLLASADLLPEVLSGGMKRRVGIARALVTTPEVLLLDDPLAGLDPHTALELTSLILEVSAGKTLVWAASEPPPTRVECPRWIWLEEGRITHDGAPAPGLLAESAAVLS